MIRKSWERITLVATLLLAWISLLNLPLHVQGADPSWEIGLGYFLRHRFQAGLDYIFTYGPLGYFLTESYEPHLYWLKYAWEIAIKGVFAGILWKISNSSLNFRDRLTFLLVAAVVATFLPPIRDALYIAFLFTGSLCLPGAVFGIVCGLLALAKFSFLLVGLFLCGIISIHRRSVAAPIFFAATFVAVWVALGQSLKNIPVYLSRSWEVAAGYDAAMATTGPTSQIVLALVVIILLSAAAWRGPWQVLVALGVVTFVSFKHAFVRQDPYHAPGFFVFAALGFIPFQTRPWLQKTGIALSVLALVAYREDSTWPRLFFDHWASQSLALVRPLTLRQKLDREYSRLQKRFALPHMRREIGTGSVDILGLFADQRTAILNNFRWQPRPVFEGYSAYTPRLLALNASFYQGSHAPDFVIVAWGWLDWRLPAANDGAAFLELLARYEPWQLEVSQRSPAVEGEKAFLLFRRTVTPIQSTAASVGFVKELPIGTALEVSPFSFQTATFDIRYSVLGKIRNFFYKPAPAFVRLTLASGEVRIYRCVPSIVASKFLLSPLIERLDDVVGLYSRSRPKMVTRLEIIADKTWFEPEVKVTLSNFALPQRLRAIAARR